jgi:hypothetical protein
MTTLKTFDVRWTDTTTAAPEAVWEAITQRIAGWLWEVEYEPFVGGAERGLTAAGGTVTVWDPPRRFQTRLDQPDGHFNQVTYDLEAGPDGGTRVCFHHTTNVSAGEHDLQLEACEAHTDLYRHSMLAAATHFAGRTPTYLSVDAAGTGDEILAALERAGGVVDYDRAPFAGIRTDDALIRVYDRTQWGWGIAVAVHSFAGAERARAIIDLVPMTEKVA